MEHEELIEGLIASGWITEALYEVKSGKEATVFCCRAHPRTGESLAAVKVFRHRHHRTFDNEAAYRDGEYIASRRARTALKNKSRFGREVQHGTWVSREAESMKLLHRAGAAVPRFLTGDSDAIVMQFFGDEEGAAPRLHQVRMDPETARTQLRIALGEIRLWLAHNLVHGDLSPYNILWWRERMTIIDFPQACDARLNRNAREFLFRDIERVAAYFRAQGAECDAHGEAEALWRDFEHARL